MSRISRPGVIATAVAVPLAVLAGVVVFVFFQPGDPDVAESVKHPVEAVEVSPPVDPAEGTGEQCATVLRALPDKLGENARRPVIPEGSMAAAWGEPVIVLYCGLPAPDVARDKQIFTINQVDWVVDTGDPDVWTTVGRPFSVQVHIPAQKQIAVGPEILGPVSKALS